MFEKVSRVLRDAKIWVHDIFWPHNVVRCSHLDRGWKDRDHVMFHAMFQLIVDFVEREQPLRTKDEGSPYWTEKLHTDLKSMHEYVDWVGSPAYVDYLCADWEDEEGRRSHARWAKQHHRFSAELLYLYEWYTTKQYEFDRGELYTAAGYDGCWLNSGDPLSSKCQLHRVITSAELTEATEAQELVCDIMLERILAIRSGLWT